MKSISYSNLAVATEPPVGIHI